MIVRFPIYLCDLNDSAQREYCRLMNVSEDRKKYLMKPVVPIVTCVGDVHDPQDLFYLGLTVRTENIIRRCNILKINELCTVLLEDPYLIMGARGMGKKSWDDLLKKMRTHLDTSSLPQYIPSKCNTKSIIKIKEEVNKILEEK